MRIYREAAGNHRQDMTGPVLDGLLADGYSEVTWNSNGSRHSECRDLNRQKWGLDDFLQTTEYDAPLFSRSHPGDQSCTLIVSGQGLPDVEVDSYGETDEAIGVSRPVKAPPAPKVKPLAPKTKTQIIEQPVPPKKPKVVYVPEDVHKQIKDPFEKQDLDQEEKKDSLKDLEKEVAEPPVPEEDKDEELLNWLSDLDKKEQQDKRDNLTDEEWDEIKDFNKETSLQKAKPWIYGLFKG